MGWELVLGRWFRRCSESFPFLSRGFDGLVDQAVISGLNSGSADLIFLVLLKSLPQTREA
jgi:hypothetical protein